MDLLYKVHYGIVVYIPLFHCCIYFILESLNMFHYGIVVYNYFTMELLHTFHDCIAYILRWNCCMYLILELYIFQYRIVVYVTGRKCETRDFMKFLISLGGFMKLLKHFREVVKSLTFLWFS